jgi:hypothetical protein
MKRKAVTAEEYDVIGGGRRHYCYLQRAGVASAIKRRMRRRERHEAHRDVRRGER